MHFLHLFSRRRLAIELAASLSGTKKTRSLLAFNLKILTVDSFFANDSFTWELCNLIFAGKGFWSQNKNPFFLPLKHYLANQLSSDCKHRRYSTRTVIGSCYQIDSSDWLLERGPFINVLGENRFSSQMQKDIHSLCREITVKKLFYKSNRELFPVFTYSDANTRVGWENSRLVMQPLELRSRGCITVSNSPNLPSCLHQSM